jgi:hypothetical protein
MELRKKIRQAISQPRQRKTRLFDHQLPLYDMHELNMRRVGPHSEITPTGPELIWHILD